MHRGGCDADRVFWLPTFIRAQCRNSWPTAPATVTTGKCYPSENQSNRQVSPKHLARAHVDLRAPAVPRLVGEVPIRFRRDAKRFSASVTLRLLLEQIGCYAMKAVGAQRPGQRTAEMLASDADRHLGLERDNALLRGGTRLDTEKGTCLFGKLSQRSRPGPQMIDSGPGEHAAMGICLQIGPQRHFGRR